MTRIEQNHATFLRLRKEYPEFVYEKYTVEQDQDKIYQRFYYHISPEISFVHEINILKKDFARNVNLSTPWVHNLAFHLGLVTLMRYWKSTCSPRVILKAGALSQAQVNWWKKLYFKGLGEFFYVNSIETSLDDFMKIDVDSACTLRPFEAAVEERNLIPIGGGKDSIVTLDILSGFKSENVCLVFNPQQARIESALLAGYDAADVVEIRRISDPRWLEWNERGYLNGHLPFSASLAFMSLFAATLCKTKYIIVSNESSANEGNVDHTDINHQYSKSFEFERDFNAYVQAYITPDVRYFSLLRPFNELQIAQRFSGVNPRFFTVFRSCNAPSRTNQWCNACAKCLFVYIILFPFFDERALVSIFGQNLLAREDLLPIFLQLIGSDHVKPFECVGTRKEVNAALSLGIRKHYPGSSKTLPYLLRFYKNRCAHLMLEQDQIQALLGSFDENHLLPLKFADVLAQAPI